jgi:hypothetical protein
MGWYITCAPLEFSTSDAKSFTDILASAHTGLRGTLGNAKFPASKVVSLLGDAFTPTRRDMFSMVSYIDYRKMPGAERHGDSKPLTLGETLQADDAHVWASRLPDGLYLTIRYPITPIAPELLGEYNDRISQVLRRVTEAGDYRLHSEPVSQAA